MDPIIPTGGQAPLFELPDLKREVHSLKALRGRTVVLNFWSAECTWCERVDQALQVHMAEWADEVRVWWIASNANETHQLIEKVAMERQLSTVLIDEHQLVANLYGAQTTPHFFVVDKEGKLAYQGAWDDITFRQRVATRGFVAEAVEALMRNETPSVTQTPPYGCILVKFVADGS